MTKRERLKAQELKRQYNELLMRVWLFWYETYGFFEDGYQQCEEKNHPLYPYFPTKGQLKTKVFSERAKTFSASRYNRS